MKLNKTLVLLIASVALVIVTSSCTTTDISSTSVRIENEMTTFDNVSFDGTVTVADLQKLGTVSATASITYELNPQGDWSMSMGEYNYSYTALTGASETSGTRKIGELKVVGAAIPADIMGGGLFGGLISVDMAADAPAPNMSAITPKQVALDAAHYELMSKVAAKGGAAILLPEYSWEIEETNEGIRTEAFLFMPASTTYTNRILKYTVTVRATAVSF